MIKIKQFFFNVLCLVSLHDYDIKESETMTHICINRKCKRCNHRNVSYTKLKTNDKNRGLNNKNKE